MGEEDPLNAAVNSLKELAECACNLGSTTSLFHRRIEFNFARKPFTDFSDGVNSGFKLEALNASTSNSGSNLESNEVCSEPGSEAVKVSEENNGGLDPELSFGITFRKIGAGLQNLGNTCFLNSVLQCLTYTEPLAAYLQSGSHKTSCRTAGFCALCAIQKHVNQALESTGKVLVPKDLVSNLRCISRNFRNARQEDAHEYMVSLLESMHKCCLPLGVPSESPSAYEKSMVHKIFGGRLRSQVKCTDCSFCSNKFDPFLDLSLEIVKADSVYKALTHFTAKEYLDGGERQYQCQQCQRKVKALKQLTVYEAPEVLTIHLKRFDSYTGQKIDRKVEFSPTLDLKPFVTRPYDGDLKYTLYGVLVHAGWSTHSGHYYCFVRTSTGMWYTLDDNKVYQVSERKVLEQKAYMLFYIRDRRNNVTKRTADIVQKESMVINALGSKGYNNFNRGLKETIQNESLGKKLKGSFSAVATQNDSVRANSLPFASECSSTLLKVPPKVDLPNGWPISNLEGGDGLLNSTSSFKQSNCSVNLRDSLGTDGCSRNNNPAATVALRHENSEHQNSVAKDRSQAVAMEPNCTGNLNSGEPLEFFSLKKDHPTETSLKVPPKADLRNGSSISNLTGGDGLLNSVSQPKECNSCLGLGNSLGTDSSSWINPTATIAMQYESNDNQNSAAEGESDSVDIKPTSVVNPSFGKDPHSKAIKPSEKSILHRSSGETSDLGKNYSGKDMDLSGSSSVADLACQNVNCMGKESVPSEAGLIRKKASDSKLRVVKRPFKSQVARMQLSSSIIFGAALERKMKKHRRNRRDASRKQDKNSVLSDIGPSTSENLKTISNDCSRHFPTSVKPCSHEEQECLKNITGNIDMVVNDQEFRSWIGQDGCVPSSDEQTSVANLSSSGELRCSNYNNGKNFAQDGLMGMLTRGLEEATVARWDGLELPSSEFVDSQSTQSVRIGYVADEWDEEYDRGKRKKIKNNKRTFDGLNPFQEASMKKQKLEHLSSTRDEEYDRAKRKKIENNERTFDGHNPSPEISIKKQKLEHSTSDANQPFRM